MATLSRLAPRNKTYPVVGDIVITTYTQPFATQSISSFFQIANGTCRQSDLASSYTKSAKAVEKDLHQGIGHAVHLLFVRDCRHDSNPYIIILCKEATN